MMGVTIDGRTEARTPMHGKFKFRSFCISRIAWVPCALLVSVLASPAFAAPVYDVFLQTTAESGGVADSDAPGVVASSPVSLFNTRQVDDTTGFASGAAGPGSIAVIGSSTWTITDPDNVTEAIGKATATSTIDDVIFSGSGTLFNVFINLDLSGFMDITGIPDAAQSTLNMSVKLHGQQLFGFRSIQIPTNFFDTGFLDGVWADGLAGFNDTISVGPFNGIPTNFPVTLRLTMDIFTSASSFFLPSTIGDEAGAIGNIGSTFSLTSSGPVFSGVPGSVDSVEGSIASGLWTGTPVTAPPIPEPSTMTLAALGAIAVLYKKVARLSCGRLRCRQNCVSR